MEEFRKLKIFERRRTGLIEDSITSFTSRESGRQISITSLASVGEFKGEVLCVHIKEARHLLAADTNPESSDPFVRLQIGGHKVYETRVVRRNRFPMWEQRHLISLESFPGEAEMIFKVLDRDVWSTDDFLGEIKMDLSTAVEIARMKPDNYTSGIWHNIMYKKGTQGALCLGFQLLSPEEAQEVQPAILKMVPDLMPAAYEGRTVQVMLHSLAGLRASGLSATRFGHSGHLFLRIKLNSFKVDMRMDVPANFGYEALWFSEGSNKLEVPIRVGGFKPRIGPMSNIVVRSPYEIFDVKIYLMHKDIIGVTYLAKAQIPLWTIPTLPPGATLQSAASGTAALQAAASFDAEGGSVSEMLEAAAREGGDGEDAGSEESGGEPQPSGKEYTRIMEPYISALIEDLTLSATLAIVPTQGPGLQSQISSVSTAASVTPSNHAGDQDDADVEEVEGAEPVPAPEPLAESVLECELPLGVAHLQAILLAGYSDFARKVHAAEKLLDMERGSWEPEYAAGATRKATYIRPLSVPMAPPQCNVVEEHKIVVMEDGGFVVEIHVRTTAPLGENFYVRQQLWGATMGRGLCRFRITMQVVFEKEPAKIRFLKGTIIKASANDCRRGWGAMMDMLRHDLAQGGRMGALPPASSVHGLPALSSGMMMPVAEGRVGAARGVGMSAVVGWAQVALLVLLLLLLMRLGGQVRGLREEVRALGQVASGSCSSDRVGGAQ